MDLSGHDFGEQPMKFPASWNNIDQMLIIDLKGGDDNV